MKPCFSALLLSALALVSQADAASLMFDFGPTTVTGADVSNSPWHTVDPSAGTTWNKITGTDNSAIAGVTS